MADVRVADVVAGAMDALPPPQPPTMTVQDFLVWEPGDGRAWQLVDGVPQPMAPTTLRHSLLQNELGYLLTAHFRAQGSPCEVFTAPGVQPRVNTAINFRIPDLGVTCTPYEDEDRMLQDAILLAEVLSPSNHAETWSNIWTYTTIPSVREILVLYSTAMAADLLRRGPDGMWPDRPEHVTKGDLVLDSVSLRVPLRSVYRATRFA